MRGVIGTCSEVIVEVIAELDELDLAALCEATDAAIIDGGGFGWVNPPGRRILESYYKGVLLVPERELFVVRVDGVIVGSAHLVMPPRNNEAQAFAAQLMHAFVAPYARGYGLARALTEAVETRAKQLGFAILNLDVRESQTAAIHMYEALGFVRWGENPNYARVKGKFVTGFFYSKKLRSKRSRPDSRAVA
jgi:hypothetical protein